MTLEEKNVELRKELENWKNNHKLWDEIKIFNFIFDNLSIEFDRYYGGRIELNLLLKNPETNKNEIICSRDVPIPTED